jgi:glycosyltransferase involved in cell wall biosynthesis
VKYYLDDDFTKALAFLKACGKTDGNWNPSKIKPYNYVVIVENDNKIVNVSFVEIYGDYVRLAIAYYTHDLSIRNLMWVKGGIAEHCMKWFSQYKGLFVSYHEKDAKLFRLCKHKLKGGSGKFLSPENHWFKYFKIEQDRKIWFKHCWQYIAYYNMSGSYDELIQMIELPVDRENLIITFQTDFTENHGGFNLELVKNIANEIGFKVCVIGRDKPQLEVDYFVPMPPNAYLNLAKQRPDDSNINFHFVKYINDHKIAINNLLFFMEWHLWPNLKPFRDISNRVFSFSRIIVKSLVEHSEIQNSSIMLKYERAMMEESDYILCGSPGIKKDIHRHYNNGDKVRVVPIYSSYLEKMSKVKKRVANPFSQDVLYVGRTDHQKGYWRIKSKRFNVRHLTSDFKLWESGPNEKLTNDWYMKIKDEMHEMFILLPAIYETRGLIVQEAMALGLIPLVQNNEFGLAEQIENGVNGFLVDFDKSVDEILEEIFSNYDIHHLMWMSESNRSRVYKMSFIESFALNQHLFAD